jgi:UDP-N-acetylglucosamine--N-acetylmuramyl-(pentapeptide) pyrophosphoryl-undecaprenol N-acetylglucosamine transferase
VKVLIAGGGTGGHVVPAMALAAACRDAGDDVTVSGASGGPEADAAEAAGVGFVGVDVISAQTRRSWRTVVAAAKILRAAWRIRGTVGAVDVVVSVGGYASAPAAIAARLRHRPLVVVEPNAVPGLVNRLTARWAAAAATMFDATAVRLPSGLRVDRTGTPLRGSVAAVAAGAGPSREDAAHRFGLAPARRTVLVVGGSQGARSIDRAVAAALPALAARADLQLLVSTGPDHLAIVAEAVDPAAPLRVVAVPFIEAMDAAYALADLAVARSGGSVAELAACGVPAILVPYPHATEDHQRANADELRRLGAARVIDDTDLTGNALADAILDLVDDTTARSAMAMAMRAWARPGATAAIVALAHEVAR